MEFLSKEERTELTQRLRKEKDKRMAYRINAVLLYDSGWSLKK
jgi:hypothetical protein